MESRAAAFSLTVAALAGCGGSLSAQDGGTGTGGTTGSGGAGGAIVDAAVPLELQRQLDDARVTWAAGKGSCNPYSYDRRWYGVFAGGQATQVEIRDDVATRRRYWMSSFQLDGGSGWTLVWDETASEVGRHASAFDVYPPSTVEQLLVECATILARDPVANQLALTIDAHGVPTTCTYRPVECVDDCLVGITIASFDCGPLSIDGGAP
jgi:hypothetical protein